MTTVVPRGPDMGGGGDADPTPADALTPDASLAAPASSGEHSSPSWARPFVAILVLGAIVSFVAVGRASFSLDESVSMSLAVSSWHSFSQTVLHRETNMVLYYGLLRGWVHLGQSEAVVRTLSVVVSVAAVGVVMVMVRRLFDRRTALVCGLLLAVDPLVVLFAQDARGYALSLLLVSASSALFVAGLGAPSGWGTWAAYALVSALAAYANFWAALVPLAHAVSLAFLPPGTVPWRRLVPTGVVLGILLVPLGLLIHASDSSGVNWAAGSSAGKVFARVRADVPHPVIDVGVLLVVVAVIAAVALVRRHPKMRGIAARAGREWPVVFALCWLVVPVAAVVLLSLVYKPLLVVRYLVVCLPPFVILVSYAVARLRGNLATVVLAALVVVSGAGVAVLDLHGSSQDWRGAVASVADRSQPGDGVVIFAPYTRTPFQWYLRQRPGAEDRLRPLFPRGSWATNPLDYDSSIGVSAPAIDSDVRGHHRVWLVLSQEQLYPTEDAAVRAGLKSAGLSPVNTVTLHGVEVVEYARR